MTSQDISNPSLSIADLAEAPAGKEVTLHACVLRIWEVGTARMCLVGDETGLVRVGLGRQSVVEGSIYLFAQVAVRIYTGGWRSLQVTPSSRIALSDRLIRVAADEAYVRKVYRILTGLEKKRQRLGARLE